MKGLIVYAEEAQTCVQVTQYGGGVGIVCGAKHEPVETGLADINPFYLAAFFFILAFVVLRQYKKLVRSEIRFIEFGGGENNG